MLSTYRTKLSRLVLWSVAASMIVSHGCVWVTEEHVLSKPTITSTADWKIEEGCGYERCGPPPVDFLVGENIAIRIENRSDKMKDRFAIRLSFLPRGDSRVAFNPSLVMAELKDGKTFTGERIFLLR